MDPDNPDPLACPTVLDREEINGAGVDLDPPTVKLLRPSADAAVFVGGPLTVEFEATDEFGVASVEVSLRMTRDMSVAAVEAIPAVRLGGNRYAVTFERLSGEPGARFLRVIACDWSGNPGIVWMELQLQPAPP